MQINGISTHWTTSTLLLTSSYPLSCYWLTLLCECTKLKGYRGFENCDRGIDDFFGKFYIMCFCSIFVLIIKICKQIKKFALCWHNGFLKYSVKMQQFLRKQILSQYNTQETESWPLWRTSRWEEICKNVAIERILSYNTSPWWISCNTSQCEYQNSDS